jgi:iron complex outermembrane receptor protein
MRISKIIPSAGVLAMLMAAPAFAQEDTSEEIVVTGTSIRGVAPVGNQVVTMDEEAIRATGATTTAQVLARIPQLSDFGGAPAVQGSNNFQLAVNRPTLRNLGSGVASTAATLFLMDGHRLPGSGVLQTFPDPDVVPPALIQRVEVVPDGGSSIYGSDAVAGVVNFITRNEFDGLEVNYRHGFGDEFGSDEVSVTGGRSWDTGSVFASYSYANRDAIAAEDRDYVRDIDWATGIPTEGRCAEPNVVINGVESAAGGGPAVRCDRAREMDLFGSDERHSVLAGFSQELSDALSFRIKGWYTARDVESNGGPLRAEVLVDNNGPNSINGANDQTVRFSFAPVQPGILTENHMETYGVSPELTWDLGHDWQNRTFLNYAVSQTNTHNPVLNPADVQAAVTSGAINPYDVADPGNIDAVNALLAAKEWRGFGQDEITQVRTVFDGPLFSLPAGQVRLAAGLEAFTERFEGFSDGTNNYVPDTPFTAARESRHVEAAFVEFNVPIVSEDNNIPLIHTLDISLSGRHDRYSDFGGVTTKRYGFTYEPVDWVSIAGHWGDSFQAPGLADIARSGNTFVALPLIPSPVLIAPEDEDAVGDNGGVSSYNFFAVQGTNPGLQPQNAEAWDISFDVTPPILDDNLTFGATYWSIDYALRIGSALTFIGNPSVFANFADKLLHDPNGLSYDQARALFPDATTTLDALEANGKPLYAIMDFRNTNTGGDRRSGVDVRASYTDETSFGTWYANINATHFIHYLISTDIGAPFQPDAAGTDGGAPDWKWSSTLGATVGDHWLAQVTWNHVGGVDLQGPLGLNTPDIAADDQDAIDDFDTFDAYVQYDVLGTGLTEGLSLTLGVQNLTDEDPPILKRTNGQAAGFPLGQSTLGRVIQVGFTQRF